MTVYAPQQGASCDGFGTKFPPAGTPTAATVTGRGTIYAINALQYPLSIQWNKIFPGVKPASGTFKLQGCDGDPTVEANWYDLDSTTDVTVNEVRDVVNARPNFIAANVTAIATPGGGVAVIINVR